MRFVTDIHIPQHSRWHLVTGSFVITFAVAAAAFLTLWFSV